MYSWTLEGVDNALPSLGAQLEDLPTTHIASIFSAIMLTQAIGRWWKALLLGPTYIGLENGHVGFCLSTSPRVARNPRLAQDKACIGVRIHPPREQSLSGGNGRLETCPKGFSTL
jgi:hypothetical protein